MSEILELRKIKSYLRQLRSKILHLQQSLKKAPTTNIDFFNIRNTQKYTFKKKRQMMDTNVQIPSPARRHLISIVDYFEQVLQQLWISDHSSLFVLSCFAVGKLLAETSPEEEEEIYSSLPLHSRRYILLEHMTQIIAQEIKQRSLFSGLIDACIENGANHQAFQIIKAFWKASQSHQLVDYKMAHCWAKQIYFIDEFVDFAANYWLANRDGELGLVEILSKLDVVFSVKIAYSIFKQSSKFALIEKDPLETVLLWMFEYFNENLETAAADLSLQILKKSYFSKTLDLIVHIIGIPAIDDQKNINAILDRIFQLSYNLAICNRYLTANQIYKCFLISDKFHKELAVKLLLGLLCLENLGDELDVGFLRRKLLNDAKIDSYRDSLGQSWKYETVLEEWINVTPPEKTDQIIFTKEFSIPSSPWICEATPVKISAQNCNLEDTLLKPSNPGKFLDTEMIETPIKRSIDDSERLYLTETPIVEPKVNQARKENTSLSTTDQNITLLILKKDAEMLLDPLTAPGTAEKLKREQRRILLDSAKTNLHRQSTPTKRKIIEIDEIDDLLL